MATRTRIIFSVILLKLITVLGSKTTEDIQEKETESFKNLPTLIEYVLDMLERRPEVLETDNVNVFKRSVNDNCKTTAEACSSTDTRYERAAYKYDSPGDNSPFKQIHEYDQDTVIKRNVGELWDSNDIYKRSRDDNNDDLSVTNIESITIGKGNIIKNTREDQVTNEVLDYDEIYEADINFDESKNKWILLSPEEVEEQILKVDQMIDDYNSKESNN